MSLIIFKLLKILCHFNKVLSLASLTTEEIVEGLVNYLINGLKISIVEFSLKWVNDIKAGLLASLKLMELATL